MLFSSMTDNKSKLSQEEYLNGLAIMMHEAFSEAYDNDLERYQLKLNAMKALTELEETELPLSAPELYKDREPILELNNKKENPFQFLYRVYGSWLGKGLFRPDIKKSDLSLYEGERDGFYIAVMTKN